MTNPGTLPASPATPDDGVAAKLRGFGPLGIAAMLVILAGNLLFAPLSALLALAWARRSRTPWRDLGFAPPRSWLATIVLGIVSGAAFKLIMKAVVMPVLGADPINRAYHYLAGNTAALPYAIYTMVVGAGFGEETVFRGYLFERLSRLFGSRAWSKPVIVALTSAVFGAAHYAQGLAGIEQGTLMGLVYGAVYAVTGRLWMPMIAHASFDLTALAIIYWDLESQVAHLFFR